MTLPEFRAIILYVGIREQFYFYVILYVDIYYVLFLRLYFLFFFAWKWFNFHVAYLGGFFIPPLFPSGCKF